MRIRFLMGLTALIGVLSGCATLSDTADENKAVTRQIYDTDVRMMADDWNLIAETRRPLRLSRWITR